MATDKTSSGIGITSILFIVFLVLKLAEIGVVATWSWWWVTSPIWIPFCLTIIVVIIYGIFLLFRIKKNEEKENIGMHTGFKSSFQIKLEERMKKTKG